MVSCWTGVRHRIIPPSATVAPHGWNHRSWLAGCSQKASRHIYGHHPKKLPKMDCQLPNCELTFHHWQPPSTVRSRHPHDSEFNGPRLLRRERRGSCHHFVKDASHAPHINLVRTPVAIDQCLCVQLGKPETWQPTLHLQRLVHRVGVGVGDPRDDHL